ncbi:YqaE/Pmp3 family membrane protein [Nostoc sp. UHCC 0702]|nr:YqaE/Pmp3 family membrane protein [Nostoc sp. UHCC 0702]
MFLSIPVSNTTQGLIIRSIIAVCMPPLSVFLTLLSKGRNPFSGHFFLNLVLMLVPIPLVGTFHAIWFIVNQESGQILSTQPLSQRSSTQQFSQPNTISSSSPSSSNTRVLTKKHMRVAIFALIFGIFISIITVGINLFNTYLIWKNSPHPTQMNLPAKPYQQNDKSR